MNFNQNLKAFLKKLPLRQLTGHQKFLAVAAAHCRGNAATVIKPSEIKAKWKKSVLGIKYNSSFYDRAQQEGWVNPKKYGEFCVAQEGLDHLSALETAPGDIGTESLKKSGSLIIVNKSAPYTFDKFLRRVLAEAKRQVLIADSYVDGPIFDNALEVIPKTTSVKVLFANDTGNFETRASRFSREYPKFHARKYKNLHDRFMVIDETGYVLGPSIKDAAMKYPALVVTLSQKEKGLLQKFFEDLWSKASGSVVI